MSDLSAKGANERKPDLSLERLRRRHAEERRFRAYGFAACATAVAILLTLLFTITRSSIGAFSESSILLAIEFDEPTIDPRGNRELAALRGANYATIARRALVEAVGGGVTDRREKQELYSLMTSDAGFVLRKMVLENPDLIGQKRDIWILASDDADIFIKGDVDRDTDESNRRITDRQIAWLDSLEAGGRLNVRFNRTLFASGDSREPELAGIRAAIVGSALTLFITLLLSFPLGILSAVYLEELAPQNRWTDLIEININNLAAVPSILFGLLGLAVFLNFFHLPRSAPLVGGMVLALMTLPTIIIAARAALKSVPPSVREAALGVGASELQVIAHHVLPLAMPGILTGTIIGMARALGETAPLLMIGMVAFIVDVPHGFTDPATALPVQIYIWADSAERAFVPKTAAAIVTLLAFLLTMNGFAQYLRHRFERHW